MQSLDLAYHDIDPESGLFMGLSQQGDVRTIVDEGMIQAALKQGPLDTRAFVRGWCVQHLKDKIEAITWSRIVFNHEGQQVVLPLGDVVDDQAIELNELVQQPGALLDALVKKAN